MSQPPPRLEKTVKTPRSRLPALILLLPAWVSAQSLTLSCDGQGTVLTTQSTTVNQYDFKHKENRAAIAQTQVHRPHATPARTGSAP